MISFLRKLRDAVAGRLSHQTVSPVSTTQPAVPLNYAERMASEVQTYKDQVNVHDLPEIFHYWSNRYLRPILEEFGFSHPEAFFEQQLAEAYDEVGPTADSPARFVSIGSGNCDAEVRVASGLVASGRPHFVLECLDINPDMLSRGKAFAESQGVAAQLRPLQADFNDWSPEGRYDAVLANQSLHHVVNLEGLFDAVARAIGDHGRFITSDMIGRNGHARWPEALDIVQEYWRELPEDYRYNQQLRRQEDVYGNWDCSVEGFEGIRAQDILPLLLDRFGFRMFVAYGNIIDPFIDRAFGHNFDADGEWDRAFVDRVHERDEAEILSGRVKPTHMMAVMVGDRDIRPVVWRHLTPEFCVRSSG
jgi:SAM-dependent methyltransferase